MVGLFIDVFQCRPLRDFRHSMKLTESLSCRELSMSVSAIISDPHVKKNEQVQILLRAHESRRWHCIVGVSYQTRERERFRGTYLHLPSLVLSCLTFSASSSPRKKKFTDLLPIDAFEQARIFSSQRI